MAFSYTPENKSMYEDMFKTLMEKYTSFPKDSVLKSIVYNLKIICSMYDIQDIKCVNKANQDLFDYVVCVINNTIEANINMCDILPYIHSAKAISMYTKDIHDEFRCNGYWYATDIPGGINHISLGRINAYLRDNDEEDDSDISE